MEFLQEEFDEILNIFRAESEEIIQRMNGNILLLEKSPTDKEIIKNLFRDAHSLKGASRMVNFNKIQLLAHRIEDVLDFANVDTLVINHEIISVLYKVLDYISELIQISVQNKTEYVDYRLDEYINTLNELLEKPQRQVILEPDIKENNNKIEEYSNCFESANKCLIKITSILDNFNESDKTVVDSLVQHFNELDTYFTDNLKEIKVLINTFLAKLKFVELATGYLTTPEIVELTEDLDKLKVILNSIIPQQQKIDEMQDLTEFSQDENLEKNEQSEIMLQKLNTLTLLLPELEFGFDEVPKIKENMDSITTQLENQQINTVYSKIYEIINNLKIKNITPQREILNLLVQCIKDSAEVVSGGEITENDYEALLQRLSIVQHIIDIDVQEQTNDLVKSDTGVRAKTKFEKPQDFLKNYETVSIKTLRVDTQKLDQLVNQMSELIVSRIKIQDHIKELNNINIALAELSYSAQKSYNYLVFQGHKNLVSGLKSNIIDKNTNRINIIKNRVSELYRQIKEDHIYYNHTIDELELMIKNVRILPLATIFHMFPRMVRDIATEKHKEIDLLISGSETSADKKIVEEIKSPLIHIIRNSIDHGIETPEEREKQGKSRVGKIHLSARSLANKIVIEIKDDGRGINLEKIKKKALSKGLMSEDELHQLSDEQIMNLIFLPGFSTGEEVTDISGRGVGLDVVQTKISQLDGKVQIYSVLGEGARVTIELPVSMATIKTFIVSTQEQFFAVPITAIKSVINVDKKDIIIKDGNNTILYNERFIPIFELDKILNLQTVNNIQTERLTVLIVESDNLTAGLIIEKLEGDQELLQKKFSPPIFRLKNISGLSTLTSGRVCFILNISDIFKTIFNIDNSLPIKNYDGIRALADNQVNNNEYKILVVDSASEMLSTMQNTLSNLNYKIKTSVDIAVAMDLIAKENFDLISVSIDAADPVGVDFIAALRTNEMYEQIPIIAIISELTEEIKQHFSTYQVNDYILKPAFNAQNYLYRVQKLLSNNE